MIRKRKRGLEKAFDRIIVEVPIRIQTCLVVFGNVWPGSGDTGGDGLAG